MKIFATFILLILSITSLQAQILKKLKQKAEDAVNKQIDKAVENKKGDKKFMQEKFNKIMQAVDEMEAAPAILKSIQQNGLQPSISSGIQAPGTFTPVKGLFN